jgi:hypothetical protein
MKLTSFFSSPHIKKSPLLFMCVLGISLFGLPAHADQFCTENSTTCTTIGITATPNPSTINTSQSSSVYVTDYRDDSQNTHTTICVTPNNTETVYYGEGDPSPSYYPIMGAPPVPGSVPVTLYLQSSTNSNCTTLYAGSFSVAPDATTDYTVYNSITQTYGGGFYGGTNAQTSFTSYYYKTFTVNVTQVQPPTNGYITGYTVDQNNQLFNAGSTLTVTGVGSFAGQPSPNAPYNTGQIPSGAHTISSTQPAGYKVSYSKNPGSGVYTQGASTSIIVPSDGSGVSLWWKYTALQPNATLKVNGVSNVTVDVGDTLDYAWSSVNGSSASSNYTVDGTACGQSGGGWIAGSLSGVSSGNVVQACQGGHNYTITYNVSNVNGLSDSSVIYVHVNPVPPTKPDLIAAGITPGTGVAGTPSTYNTTISNTGETNATASYTLYQVDTVAHWNAQNYTNLQSLNDWTPGIVAGGSTPSAISWTPPVAGQYYMRACADLYTSYVNESDETDNCGPLTLITVSPAVPTPVITGPTVGVIGATYTFTADGIYSDAQDNSSHTASRSLPTVNGFFSKLASIFKPARALAQAGSPPMHYGLDNNNNLTVDRWLPDVSTWDPPGKSENWTSTWNTPGPHTFNVMIRQQTGESSGWATHTITISGQSDLTPGAAPTVTGTVGQPVTVNGTVKNIGDGSTVTGFNDMFVTNVNAQGTAWNTIQTATPASPARGAGGTSSFSTTFAASNFPSAGNYAYAYCVDYDAGWNQSIAESNENNNCVNGTIVMSQPDLTPGTAPTFTTVAGQPVTVTGTVSNIGSAGTGIGFNNMFVTNLNAQGTAWGTIQTATPKSSAVAPAGTASFSTVFDGSNFPTAGNYPYAYCVDYDSGWNQLIAESNENNNCTSGTITVTPPPVTGTCSITPSTDGYVGDPYTWKVSGVSGGTGTYTYSWTGSENLSGTTATVRKTYTTAGTKSASVTITSGSQSTTINCSTSSGGSGGPVVIQSCDPTLTANPTTVNLGGATSLSWTIPSPSCTTSCVFSDGHAVSGISGSYSATPPTPSSGNTDNYSMTCGSNTSNIVPVTVNVPTATISVAPNRVRKGNPTTVTWGSTYVQSCDITRNGVAWKSNLPANASQQVNGTAPSTINNQVAFVITCVNGAGGGATATARAVVNVIPDFQEF